MAALGSWRTSLPVPSLDPEHGVTVPVVVGLVDTAAGGVQVVLQVGDDRPVILALQDARQLAQNVNETTAERLRVTAEALGDDQPRGADLDRAARPAGEHAAGEG